MSKSAAKTTKSVAKKTVAKKPVAKKVAAKAKTVAKKAPTKKVTTLKVAPTPKLKPSPAYMDFIATLQIGQTVSIYNTVTGSTHSTKVIAANTKHITTRRQGSDDSTVFTAKGTGTEATGSQNLKLVPYSLKPMVRSSNRKFRPTTAKFTTAIEVEAHVELLVA